MLMKTTFLMTVTVVLSGRTAPLPPRTLVCVTHSGEWVLGRLGPKVVLKSLVWR